MQRQYIVDLRENRLPISVGNKARNLRALLDKGFPVPATWVLTWEGYLQYAQDNTAIVTAIQDELTATLDPQRCYAVRSSANIEDSLAYSFAGQFKSVLQVRGINDIFRAVWSIWGSAHSQQVQSYLDKLPPDQRELKMAVILQEMVEPVISGVAFSKNPINGMDEIVVEAVRGSGDALVQEGRTPNRWIYKWGHWITTPVSGDIPDALALEIVQYVQKIAAAFKRDIDLEWVYDGKQVYFVQMRDITSLASVTIYSNALSKDMLPGAIKPLIWSVNVPLVNGAWCRLLTEFIGPNDIDPLSLAKQFYYRAYFNMSTFGTVFNRLGLPGESLEMMMGVGGEAAQMPKMKMDRHMMRLMPRMIPVMWNKWNFHRQIEREIPALEEESRTFDLEHASKLTEAELLGEVERLFKLTQRLAYFNIVGPLLMYMYTGILRGQFKKKGLDFEQLDLMAGIQDCELYDPGIHLDRLSGMISSLDEDLARQVRESSYDEFLQIPGIEPLQLAVKGFLARFGHLSDSGNDFSKVPWREAPDLMFMIIRNHQHLDKKSDGSYTFDQLPFKGLNRLAMKILYRRARTYRLYRERIGSLYTHIYGLFRVYFLTLGEKFVQRGFLEQREDIFYLYHSEVKALAAGETVNSLQLARERCEEMEQMKAVPLPGLIYGDQAPPVLGLSNHRLTGTATSRGCYTGPVRVVQGIMDFPKVKVGDVLVVPFSDVGWTPLFTKAGGVVAESGGMLSHSSIIAREYKIPAVVSVNGALALEDDTIVTVDGYRGEILIHEKKTNGNGNGNGRVDDPGTR